MKVLIVSGFLGAGKTTFITEMAKVCRQKFVVMENEMGAIGVDGGLLSSSLGKDIDIWELTEGCICCSMKTDFATSVLTIENTLSPEYLLVEPTGVGMLSQIIANLRQIAYERIEILSPVTILDALNCFTTSRDFPEIFTDQLASAGTVVLSKTEKFSADECSSIEKFVEKYTHQAEIIVKPYSNQPFDWWDKLWRRTLNGEILPPPRNPDAGLDSVGLLKPRLPSPFDLTILLEKIIRGKFGNIVRAKGILATGKEKLRFDVAGGQYSLMGIDDENADPKAVFIGRNIDSRALRRILDAEN